MWNFGEVADNRTDAATTTNTYTSPGTFTVTLTVVDDEGSTSSPVTQSVFINDPPVAAFTFVENFLAVDFDGTTSTDDNAVTTFRWNWNDSTPV